MTNSHISKVTYLIAGFGVGSLIGIFFAPRSGDETREYLTNKAKQVHEFAGEQARDLKEHAEELVERGKEAVVAKKAQIATAVSIGRDAYRYECEMARKI